MEYDTSNIDTIPKFNADSFHADSFHPWKNQACRKVRWKIHENLKWNVPSLYSKLYTIYQMNYAIHQASIIFIYFSNDKLKAPCFC